MKTKDLLLVASGLALGYLVFKKDLFKTESKGLSKVTSGAEQVASGVAEMVTDTAETVKDVFVEDRKKDCAKKWEEFSKTARFSSEQGMLEAKAKFMNNCLLG